MRSVLVVHVELCLFAVFYFYFLFHCSVKSCKYGTTHGTAGLTFYGGSNSYSRISYLISYRGARAPVQECNTRNMRSFSGRRAQTTESLWAARVFPDRTPSPVGISIGSGVCVACTFFPLASLKNTRRASGRHAYATLSSVRPRETLRFTKHESFTAISRHDCPVRRSARTFFSRV